MPNIFAYIALYAWPLVMVILFRKLPISKAVIWSLLAGFLLLPSAVEVKLPMIPAMGKTTIPNMAAAILCFLALRKIMAGQKKSGVLRHGTGPVGNIALYQGEKIPLAFRTRGEKLFLALLALYFLTPFVTVMTNTEPLFYGPVTLPGLRLYDMVSIMISLSLTIIPLLIGRYFLATPDSHSTFLKAICLGAIAYSLPMIFEARMSPQLHTWVYGFFQHSFLQHIRAGGYRPVVFLTHGLILGIYIALAVLAAMVLWRENIKNSKGLLWIYAFGWLCFALVLTKSLGPLVLTLIFAPVLMLCKVRGQLIIAAVISILVLTYPILRGAGLIPLEEIHAYVLSLSEDRAQSLKYRFDNEDLLLARASEKPLAGWGTWGRQEIFDASTGRSQTVSDGVWIITIGVFGWLGYIAYFGLLTLPVLLLALRARRLELSVVTSGMALILTVNLLDLIPNSSVTPLTFLMGGALMGRYALGNLAAEARAGEERPLPAARAPAPPVVRQPRRARS